MGIYWISGAVIRSIQQVLINKHIDKMDLNAVLEKNKEKYEKSLKKNGLSYGNQMKKVASASTKNRSSDLSDKEKEEKIEKAKEFYRNHQKEGSIASKIRYVDQYNSNNEGR